MRRRNASRLYKIVAIFRQQELLLRGELLTNFDRVQIQTAGNPGTRVVPRVPNDLVRVDFWVEPANSYAETRRRAVH